MVQQILVRKRFGPIPVGNPTLASYPKHSNISDCLNDRRVLSFDIIEVRSRQNIHVSLLENSLSCSVFDTPLPRESSKFLSCLEAVFRSEKNTKPRFKLTGYSYTQD